MARITQVTAPSAQTEPLLAEIKQLDGLVSLRVQREISIQPPGDVITVESTSRSLPALTRVLIKHGIGQEPGGSFTTSEPASVVSSTFAADIIRDVNDATWEEMEHTIAKESNMTLSALLLMAVAGIVATIGLATNAIHLVVGAMVIAPGFEPIVRISLGAVARNLAWRRGLSDMAKGYAALLVAAALTTLVLRALGKSPLGGETSYLPSGVLVSYWSSITLPSLISSFAASAAGALLIATNRSVLTAGVMIALALVPTAALAGMALASGQWELAGMSGLRWGIEAVFVAVVSIPVFLWKRNRVQQRDMIG